MDENTRMDLRQALGVLDSRGYTGNGYPIEAILWDEEAKALSFRYCAGLEHVNVWLPRTEDEEIRVESNNRGAGSNPRILWEAP